MRTGFQILLLGLMFASPTSQADTLRCGTQLVSTGDRTFDG